jgi:hypothetical protein
LPILFQMLERGFYKTYKLSSYIISSEKFLEFWSPVGLSAAKQLGGQCLSPTENMLLLDILRNTELLEVIGFIS